MLSCIICGGKLKITVTGGEFLVREGSTSDNINFEKVERVDFTTAEKMDEDIMLQVDVGCSADASHRVFAHTDSAIRAEIYQRIATAAIEFRNKYHSV